MQKNVLAAVAAATAVVAITTALALDSGLPPRTQLSDLTLTRVHDGAVSPHELIGGLVHETSSKCVTAEEIPALVSGAVVSETSSKCVSAEEIPATIRGAVVSETSSKCVSAEEIPATLMAENR